MRRWLRRTDDARRMKGDPPPTYAQLEARVRALAVENARLRTVVAEKTQYVEHLALDLAEARGAPKPASVAVDEDVTRAYVPKPDEEAWLHGDLRGIAGRLDPWKDGLR
jgi:hypothetical protein